MRLTLLFMLAVLGVIASVYLLVAAGLRYQYPETSMFDMVLLLEVCLAVVVVIAIGAAVKVAALSAGGSAVAEALGGRLVSHSTNDPAEKRLVNVVEEMAIASGVSVPQIYLLDEEQGVNAFAAGHRPDDAAIAVTRGTLKILSRAELQGVIGHEFSHILNGDMRLNIRLLGMLGGIMAIAIIGRVLLRFGGASDKKNSDFIALGGFALFLIGYIGVIAGRVIQASISRQREFLADASSVQFTRNPAGIAGALYKILLSESGSTVEAPTAAEASHMFFGPISLSSIFATHPPLEERISRIEDNTAELLAAASKSPLAVTRGAEEGEPASGNATGAGAPVAGLAGRTASEASKPGQLSATVGVISAWGIEASSELLCSLPKPVERAIHSPLGACAVIWALLLDSEPDKRDDQVEALRSTANEPLFSETVAIFPHVQALDPSWWLPLIDMAVPSLRSLSPAQFVEFRQALDLLIRMDQEVTLFEFCVSTVIDRRVSAAASRVRLARPQRLSPDMLKTHTLALLTAVCASGGADPFSTDRAFKAATDSLDGLLAAIDHPNDYTFSAEALASSLEALAQTPLETRRSVLDACSAAVLFDRIIDLEEAQLLRAVAYSLDLPLPPFLG